MSYEKKTVLYNKTTELPYDFNWRTYVTLNEDLYGFSEKKAIKHYLLFGKNENRVYKSKNMDTIVNHYESTNDYENARKYKEININSVNINSLEYDILNEITDSNYIINDLWCHVHSNNPNEVVDNEIFTKLTKYFSVIFTCESKIILDMPKDFTILYINNKDCNIDKKNYVLKYLTEKKYDHDLLMSMTY